MGAGMGSKRSWLGALVLSTTLSAACGGDKEAGAAPVGGNGATGGRTAGTNTREDPDSDGDSGAMFPNDKAGPVVTFRQPTTMAGKAPIVGGMVVVEVSLMDEPAGVDASKLYATIEETKGTTVRLEPVAAKDTFTFTFDAAQFEAQRDVTVQVHAEDTVGNVTLAPLLMELDTKAPWVSLEPPRLRLAGMVKTDVACSGDFDPLDGGDGLGGAPKDGEVIEQNARFRAFIWERAINIKGSTEAFYAGVNEATAQLLVQDVAGERSDPLLTDGPDKDEFCDAVDDTAAKAVSLRPVKTAGIVPPGEGTEGNDPPYSADCTALSAAKGVDTSKFVCDASDLKYVPTHDGIAGGAAVVFAINVTGSGVGCTGISWDSGTASGWTCVVARAWDRAAPDGQGNLGFSKPIRVCRKVAKADCEGANAGEILKPPRSMTCTDGCTMPPEVEAWGHPPILWKR